MLRTTKAAALKSIDQNMKTFVLGKKNKDFEFSDLKFKVEFIECTAKSNESNGLGSIVEYLEKIA